MLIDDRGINTKIGTNTLSPQVSTMMDLNINSIVIGSTNCNISCLSTVSPDRSHIFALPAFKPISIHQILFPIGGYLTDCIHRSSSRDRPFL